MVNTYKNKYTGEVIRVEASLVGGPWEPVEEAKEEKKTETKKTPKKEK